MEKLLMITSSPHFRAKTTTRIIMGDVLLAMLPALVASVVLFGIRALLLTAVCVVACVLFEYIYRKLMHLDNTVSDLSAAVTGMLLAFNLPVSMPLWMAVIGCLVSIVVVKQLFGGLGKNFANPALVGRIVLLMSFGSYMTGQVWPVPAGMNTVDTITAATPLEMAQEGFAVLPRYTDLFLGNIGGCIGEVCTAALLLGGVYLVARKIITVTIPLTFMATVFVLSFLVGADPVYQLLSGGLVLGAIFMGTDYSTSPTTEKGKLIFGVGCGVITVAIRTWGNYPEGVSFAILLMNIATPHIDNLTRIKALGGADNG